MQSNRMKNLIAEARESCKFRGHKMSRFHMLDGINSDKYTAHCKICGKGVWIIEFPLPNDIDIGGQAVALSCKD